jgi:hypothetical protein
MTPARALISLVDVRLDDLERRNIGSSTFPDFSFSFILFKFEITIYSTATNHTGESALRVMIYMLCDRLHARWIVVHDNVCSKWAIQFRN